MTPRADIEFREADAPIREAITKFGGQPVWIETPTWPLSKATGRPMRFIAQVALDPEIFGAIPVRMAYLFMTEDEEWVDGTYDPEGGENALILQPGHFDGPTTNQAEGPTLSREFAVSLVIGEDPETRDLESEDLDCRNQIGGVPTFLQAEEYPKGGPWRLLLQLDSARVPFEVNFGDAGVGYAFVSQEGTVGKFLWQCS